KPVVAVLVEQGIERVPIVRYLSADQEDKYTIAPASARLDEDGQFVDLFITARLRGDFPVVAPHEINYMDVSSKQLVSAAAALIPFLEHDDANRALMGSNMQRQAVPLLRTEAPLIGTGLECEVAFDSGVMVVARNAGVVTYVSADRIVVKRDEETSLDLLDEDVHELTKFKLSNQQTCINQRPIVRVGDRVTVGDVLADGQSTDNGDLALGANVLVAFMPWNGCNFEDAIVVSERLLHDDVFTSIHIEEFQLQVRDTKRGSEEITREIPNVGEQAIRNLDEQGIIRIGAEVKPGDILVGKITPKGETELSPEERLLRAIFGEKAGDVRDASLRAPSGMDGVVMDRKVFSRKERDEKTKRMDREHRVFLETEAGQRIKKVKEVRDRRIAELLMGKKVGVLRNIENNSVIFNEGRFLDEDVVRAIDLDNVRADGGGWTDDEQINEKVCRLIRLADEQIGAITEELEQEIDKLTRGDELPPGIVQLVNVYIARKRKLSVGDKIAGRHGNKGVVAKIVPVEDMPHLPDGTPVDIVLNPLGVPSRMNLGQIFETHLGWAAHKLGIHVETPVFSGATLDEIKQALRVVGLPESGKTILYDGKTGESFDQEVAVGYIYIMKLLHLVSDKIHARSIGPYSLVTQQPLGGKAQFGGQRFGEMEVWALEAYGAAYLLQEMLTVKSDDVTGRSRIYEAIVKGENPPEPGIPESFNVLVKELQSLCLDVRLEDGTH
ncbi:MAG: DNA-directed RNA polymerase subunit beta, partial [Candidatus Latescibacteria bacterium]|nr:DNA-directed RNA polymerase subunit beta [Candidatus Latescibacterota bacterium]